ncbi:MAG: phosphatase PAP2 family protein [Anaerolineae bacterium]
MSLNFDRRDSSNWRIVRVLGVMALLAGGIWVIAQLIEFVRPGAVRAFDEAILLAMRHPDNLADPVGAPWVESLARDITALGSVGILTLLTGAITAYLLLSGQTRLSLFLLTATGSGALLSFALKAAFQRLRPDVVPHAAYATSPSFPSGHTMMSAVTYLTLAVLLAGMEEQQRVRVYLVGLAISVSLLVGVSRIYLGVHWPTDVLGGWAFGAAWALFWWWAARSLRPDVTGRAGD